MMADRPGRSEGPLVEVRALVDSGAYRSSFPLQVAGDLGIEQRELVEDQAGGVGVGSHFRVWTTPVPIRAGVALFEAASDGTRQPWGPGFTLTPAFIEHDAFLLGRADFFRAFTVTFEETPEGPVFHLDTLDS
jgi:hypothetical protein